jgi:hypothetical protein
MPAVMQHDPTPPTSCRSVSARKPDVEFQTGAALEIRDPPHSARPRHHRAGSKEQPRHDASPLSLHFFTCIYLLRRLVAQCEFSSSRSFSLSTLLVLPDTPL